MNRIACMTIAALLASSAATYAGPVLLASFGGRGGTGNAAPGGVPNDARVQFVLEISPNFSSPGPRLGMGLFWEDGDHGVFDFTSDTADDFDAFVTLATNGLDDAITQWSILPWGAGGGGGASESWLYGTPADLIGNVVERIRLIVHEVNIEYPWIPPYAPDESGIYVASDVTYEVYGAPIIPEPATSLLIIMGVPFLMRGVASRILQPRENRGQSPQGENRGQSRMALPCVLS